MSTRANIEFKDEWDTYFIDSSHDGFPENILGDIEKCLTRCRGRWSGSELGQLVSYFLGMNYDEGQRIQRYEPCIGRAGDEYYCSYVHWDDKTGWYTYGVNP